MRKFILFLDTSARGTSQGRRLQEINKPVRGIDCLNWCQHHFLMFVLSMFPSFELKNLKILDPKTRSRETRTLYPSATCKPRNLQSSGRPESNLWRNFCPKREHLLGQSLGHLAQFTAFALLPAAFACQSWGLLWDRPNSNLQLSESFQEQV